MVEALITGAFCRTGTEFPAYAVELQTDIMEVLGYAQNMF